MEWTSKAIILSKQQFSDEKLLCTLISEDHGIYKSLVNISKKTSNQVQVGNIVLVTWRARLQEQMGSFRCELIKSLPMAIINERVKLAAVASLADLVRHCLPERTKEKKIYDYALSFLLTLKNHNNWLEDYIRFEILLLDEIGFGLSLNKCAVTGSINDIHYVSPKTGMAVSQAIGANYHDKLLVLPNFLKNNSAAENFIDYQDSALGLKLTGYFIQKFIDNNKKSSLEARKRFVELIS